MLHIDVQTLISSTLLSHELRCAWHEQSFGWQVLEGNPSSALLWLSYMHADTKEKVVLNMM
jgi:hypothetical protein